MNNNMANIFQDSFSSITQYDKRFDGLFEQIKKKGYSCSYFSILTCLKFLQGYFSDVNTHEQNIIDAMTITCLLDVSTGLSFEDLIIGCTDHDHKKIIGTTVELIVSNVIGINEMFPKMQHENEKYAVMFLKNEKYFVVMVDKDGFYLRDCHIDVQQNFKSIDELYLHLGNSYQFTNEINIDGFQFEEYSSVEFLIFDQQFNSDILLLLEVKQSNISDKITYSESNKKINEINEVQYSKKYNLKGDIFDVPEKVLFTKKDIEYLELLNIQLNNQLNGNSSNELNEEQILYELYKEVEEFNNDEFVKTLVEDINPDEMVDF